MQEDAAAELLAHRPEQAKVEVAEPEFIGKDVGAVKVRVDGVSELVDCQAVEALQPAVLEEDVLVGLVNLPDFWSVLEDVL